jgi:hypothetical protein
MMASFAVNIGSQYWICGAERQPHGVSDVNNDCHNFPPAAYRYAYERDLGR